MITGELFFSMTSKEQTFVHTFHFSIGRSSDLYAIQLVDETFKKSSSLRQVITLIFHIKQQLQKSSLLIDD